MLHPQTQIIFKMGLLTLYDVIITRLYPQVKDDINKFKMESVDLENERKKILGDLEDKLANTTTMRNAFDQKYDGTMKTLDQLKSGG